MKWIKVYAGQFLKPPLRAAPVPFGHSNSILRSEAAWWGERVKTPSPIFIHALCLIFGKQISSSHTLGVSFEFVRWNEQFPSLPSDSHMWFFFVCFVEFGVFRAAIRNFLGSWVSILMKEWTEMMGSSVLCLGCPISHVCRWFKFYCNCKG